MSRVTLYQLWCRSGSWGLCGVQRGFRGEEEISGKKSGSHLKVDEGGTSEDEDLAVSNSKKSRAHLKSAFLSQPPVIT